MARGRPPGGPELVDGMEGSPGAKARLRVILETITGTKTIAQACMSLGIGEAAFHKLRSRFLQEALRGLEPRPVGRRPKESPEEKERVQALMDEINALRKDLTAALVREEIAVALPQLVKKNGKRNPEEDSSDGRKGAMERHEEMHVKRIQAAFESRHEGPGRRRRGFSAQRRRREVERGARKDALMFRRWTLLQGGTKKEAASRLQISPRTLSDWERKWSEGRLREKPRGRPLKQAGPVRRGEFMEVLNDKGPQTGVRPLRALFPDMARGEILDVLWRYRRIFTRRNRLVVHSLSWEYPGMVWAMDHTDAPLPVDGFLQSIFSVRDLGSENQILWLPVEDATALVAIRALNLLFLHHGPPLVLKSDNGSAFISDEMARFLNSWGVIQLLSPPGIPQYNGSCEAGIGAMEVRTRWEAVRDGRWIDWNWEDMERARIQANQTPRGIGFPAPEEVWKNRPAISCELREAFRNTIHEEEINERKERGVQPEAELERYEQSSIDRVSISRALVAHGILRYRKRDIPLPIKKIFRAKIS